MIRQIKRTADQHGDQMPQAFGRWFSMMYFPGEPKIEISDGAGDGKVDLLVRSTVGKSVRFQIVNTKFTNQYDKGSPVSFYDEITRYWQAFENKANRPAYLKNAVGQHLQTFYKKLFGLYDDGAANLYFLTNHRINEKQYNAVSAYGVTIFHLDEVLQYVAEHLEGAMPETESLTLTGISNVLTPATNESEVPTSIVFARLIDFLKYMDEKDPFDLLFARNVRLWLGNTETNKEIRKTFIKAPKEFAYSNNGITILCKKHRHDPGTQELRLENPRVVNGSQTLHSIKNVDSPSSVARVMVRIIEIPPSGNHDLPGQVEKRKDVIHKISIRSNQQNPIRRWNLVSNDDFQNELARYFWDKKLYYERRQHEWKQRKVELSSIGIHRGPDIRWMTQLIASYHYDRKSLGPAIAQGRLNELFDEEAYSIIRESSPAVAYHLYVLGDLLDYYLHKLSGTKQYIRAIYGYVDLSLFAIVCKILLCAHLRFGNEDEMLHLNESGETSPRVWKRTVKKLVDHIVVDFKRVAAKAAKDDGLRTTPANYFKSTTLINALIAKPIPKAVSKAVLELMKRA
jgi:hypothetical protein